MDRPRIKSSVIRSLSIEPVAATSSAERNSGPAGSRPGSVQADEPGNRPDATSSSSSSVAKAKDAGSASPSNQPIELQPPKPTRIVVSPSHAQVRSLKRRKTSLDGGDGGPIRVILDEILLLVFGYFVGKNEASSGELEEVEKIPLVCKRWRDVFKRQELWDEVPPVIQGKINRLAFVSYGLKNQGTEGLCYKVCHRASRKFYAMKKARVYPSGEGVPYYMLRELAFLQGLSHPNIAQLERIALSNNELFVIFKYIDISIFDLMNPTNEQNASFPLPLDIARKFLFQILKGVAFCHQRGVLHRNLKPKHLLIDLSDPRGRANGANWNKEEEEIDKTDRHALIERARRCGRVKMSDFALVRSASLPLRQYTKEVVTLWYRAPEVLMGGHYFAAVDLWSVGCVFAEMLVGKPLFPGICEVDQLFQIFSKLGTPDKRTWEEFQDLPNYSFKFPNWKKRPLQAFIPALENCPEGLDLLTKLLDVNPSLRITAQEALQHPFFQGIEDVETDDAVSVGFTRVGYRHGVGEKPTVSRNRGNNSAQRGGLIAENYGWSRAGESSQGSVRRADRPGLASPKYLESYYCYLKSLEKLHFPILSYLSHASSGAGDEDQKRLQPVHRAMLVDWLVEVVDVFEMSSRSVFLAVNYTDRYLSSVSVDRKHFQLLGATCLHIASKCEDVSYIGVDDLVVCADKVYNGNDVLQLEEKVLTKLDFRLAVPTVIDFLNTFVERIHELNPSWPAIGTDVHLARYFAELSLQDSNFIQNMPSLVAAAAVVLALHYTHRKVVEEQILSTTGYSLQDLKQCILKLRRTHLEVASTTQLVVIKKRYETEKFMKVAFIEQRDVHELLNDAKGPKTATSSAE